MQNKKYIASIFSVRLRFGDILNTKECTIQGGHKIQFFKLSEISLLFR